ncbi:MAG: hydrogenase maturation protease [Anaerosomatales bacterium]|nr:hydrogenase maturation protease [Coriobacteriia bacterium]MDI6692799.1 hydrogenase maturation protease [Anaerosomatales bacterium]MDI6843952.1 hydrogenase maturation protease [Anaerosomatales bacterium]
MAQERILVLGVGNALMRDEGVGPRVVEELSRAYTLPKSVRVVDAGTLGFAILHLLRDADYVLVVDAVDGTSHPPGTVLRLKPEHFAPNQVLHSLHDVRLVDVLNAARLSGIEPDVECVGVQVEDIAPEEFSIGLTPLVEAAVPRAVAAVLMLLEERGAHHETSPGADPELVGAVERALAEMRARLRETGSSAAYS